MLSYPRLVIVACAFTLQAAAGARTVMAALADYPDCPAVGPAVVNHACFHASNGPFETVTASSVRDFAAPAPNVNTVHTQFTVVLPGAPGANEGTVKYRPARSGDWAVFANPAPALAILDPAGAAVPIELSHPTSCGPLPRVMVATLAAGVTYRLVIGPAAAGSVQVVLEKLTDFETPAFRDADADGFGNVNQVLASACVAPPGYVLDESDCDDTRASIHPGAPESCNGRDDDCDGATDEGHPLPCPATPVPALGTAGLMTLGLILGLLVSRAAPRRRPHLPGVRRPGRRFRS